MCRPGKRCPGLRSRRAHAADVLTRIYGTRARVGADAVAVHLAALQRASSPVAPLDADRTLAEAINGLRAQIPAELDPAEHAAIDADLDKLRWSGVDTATLHSLSAIASRDAAVNDEAFARTGEQLAAGDPELTRLAAEDRQAAASSPWTEERSAAAPVPAGELAAQLGLNADQWRTVSILHKVTVDADGNVDLQTARYLRSISDHYDNLRQPWHGSADVRAARRAGRTCSHPGCSVPVTNPAGKCAEHQAHAAAGAGGAPARRMRWMGRPEGPRVLAPVPDAG